jgi:hypothetical protein
MMKIKAEACTRRRRKELQSTVLKSATHFFGLQPWVRRSRHREPPMYISLPIPSFLSLVIKISLKIRVGTRDQMLVFESKRKRMVT